VRAVDPRARFITAEPLIHVEAGLGDEEHRRGAEAYRQSQFEALDLLCGRSSPRSAGPRTTSTWWASTTTRTISGTTGARRSPWATTPTGPSARCWPRPTPATGARCSSRRPGRRAAAARPGSTTCAPRSTPPWRRACRSGACASTPWPTTPAGRTSASARSASCRPRTGRDRRTVCPRLARELRRQQAAFAEVQALPAGSLIAAE
jgi:hypothetical protein